MICLDICLGICLSLFEMNYNFFVNDFMRLTLIHFIFCFNYVSFILYRLVYQIIIDIFQVVSVKVIASYIKLLQILINF